MPRDNSLQLRKEQSIKEAFNKLYNERTKKGTRKYTVDFILEQLEPVYFLSPRTIQSIVFGEYDKRRAKNII